ncbi:MAG: hypothetical protein ACOCTT_03450 [archaeon]
MNKKIKLIILSVFLLTLLLPGIARGIEVETLDETDVTYESAVLNGELLNLSGFEEVEVYFKVIEKGEPYIGDWPSTDKILMNETGEFSYDLSELNYNSTYEFIAVAEQEESYDEGEVKNFTTEEAPDPEIETIEAKEIDHKSAILKGNLFNVKDEEIEVFFRYREEGEEWIETPVQRLKEGEFNQSIEDLDYGANYEFKAVMKQEEEEIGEILEFTTLEEPDPEVETVSIGGLTSKSVILKGHLNYIGEKSLVEVNFQYREKGKEWNETDTNFMSSEDIFSELVEDLEPETEYEFRAMVKWETNEDTGEILNFTTTETEGPLIQTNSPENVTYDSAVLKGDLIDLKNQTQVKAFFKYREKEGEWRETPGQNIEEEKEIEEEVIDLNSDTEYEFKSVVEWEDEGESKENLGITTEFKTNEEPEPELNTLEAINISYDSVILRGEIHQLGDSLDVFFKYRKENEEWMETSSQMIEEEKELNYPLTNLEEGTNYEFKFMGELKGEEIEGEVFSFTTLDELEIKTLEASEILSNSVLLEGELSEVNEEVKLFFKYRKEDGEWMETSKRNIGNNTVFSESVTGLESDSEYEFKAVVEGDDGEYRLESNSVEFNTLRSLEEITPTSQNLIFIVVLISLGVFSIYLGKIDFSK